MSRNVVLVTADSLRADHCGFMGYDRDTTPTLNRMAENGLVFENAVAPGASTPEAMSAVHTGRFLKPYRSSESQEVIVNRRENVRYHLRNHPTIAETLSRADYTTIAFTPNPFTARYFGFDKGFDHYEDFLTEERWLGGVYNRIFRQFIAGNTSLTPIRLLLNWLEGEEIFKSWKEYYDQIIEQVRAASEPYFLWVFLLDTHLPYLVGRARRDGVSWLDMWRYNLRLYRSDSKQRFTDAEREELIELYDATIGLVDEFVGELRSDLAEDGPVYIVHADHGEAFGEHGTYGHEPYLYEENVHVPFIVANGERTGTHANPVSICSIAPLVASLADVDHALGGPAPLEGGRNAVLSNPFGSRTALRSRDWKFIWNREDGVDNELYHIREDPRESRNTVDEYSTAAEQWRRWIEQRVEQEHEALHIATSASSTTQQEQL